MKKISNFLVLNIIFYLYTPIIINGQSKSLTVPYTINIKDTFKNLKPFNLSRLGSELTYIPLETTAESMIGEIYQVESGNKYIFINETGRLLQFANTGKFIRQIGSVGRGPKEYTRVLNFCLDTINKEVYILSASKKMLTYGFDGTYKYEINLGFRPAQVILKDQNTLMFHLVNAPGQDDPSWILTSKKGVVLTKMKNTVKRTIQLGYIVMSSPLYRFKGSVHFMEFGVDTIYYFNNNQKKPYASLFMGDLKMDPNANVKDHRLQAEKLWLNSIVENDGFMFLKFYKGMSNTPVCAVYDKGANSVTFIEGNGLKNDIIGGTYFWPEQALKDQRLIGYLDAFDILKREIPADLRKKINQTSNPVLMILK